MRLLVTGTDTDVGKTIFAAALAGALGASYWKPIQAGGLDHTDSDIVRDLSGLPPEKILPERYRFKMPCSPHRAAELEDIRIEHEELDPPDADPLVVEGSGGLLVPLGREAVLADLFARWRLPSVLVARTGLGTINHSLLSIHALRSWGIPLLGVAFVGDGNCDSEEIICAMGGAKRLGRLPRLDPLGRTSLHAAFSANFRLADFR